MNLIFALGSAFPLWFVNQILVKSTVVNAPSWRSTLIRVVNTKETLIGTIYFRVRIFGWLALASVQIVELASGKKAPHFTMTSQWDNGREGICSQLAILTSD